MKKKIKAWGVFNNRDFDKARGQLIEEQILDIEYADCMCQASSGDGYAIFLTKRDAESYKKYWQVVKQIEIVLPKSKKK